MKKIFIFLSLGVVLSCSHNVTDKKDPLTLYVLNVGNASCMVFHCPGSSEAVIYDCGKRRDTPQKKLRNEIFPLLKDKKITLILSHAHTDHYNFIPEIKKNFPLVKVFYAGRSSDYPFDLSTAQAFPKGRGPDFSCGEAQFKILTSNNVIKENASSTVMLVKHGKVSILLPSDATGVVQSKAIEQLEIEKLLDTGAIDLLFGSHHGDKNRESNSLNWAEFLKPRRVIFSSGINKNFMPPYCEISQRYEPYLNQTVAHTFSCAEDKNSLRTFETNFAQYTTRNSKGLKVTSNGLDLTIEPF